MNILILSTRIPYPLTAGFRIRIYNTAKYLKSAGHTMGLIQLSSSKLSKHDEEHLRKVFDSIITIKISKIESIKNLFTCIFRRQIPFQVALYQNKEMKQKLKKLSQEYDVIIANHIRTAEYIKLLQGIKKVLDMHDAISYNYLKAMKYTKGIKQLVYRIEYKRLISYERDIVHSFDKVVLISSEDRNHLKKNNTNIHNIEIIPVAVRDDIKNCKTNYLQDQNAICFLGKMSYQPNEDAVLWFYQNVFQTLKSYVPDLLFYILGIEPTKKVLALANTQGIIVTGYVENPYEIVKQCKAMVVPLRYGAGMQNKILESMVVGTPTVISSIAAEGLQGVDGKHFLIANTSNDYIEKLLFLMSNPKIREYIGYWGQEHIRNMFSWDIIAQKCLKIIQS